ncbi:synaptobrevin [Geopyxis carbonaria]|nr:synaptobrevin [Geopyxis carbonaria]
MTLLPLSYTSIYIYTCLNSLFNSALKQSQSIKKDLESFSDAPITSSPALQGQISASLTSLARTIDDYDSMARRELIPVKKEKAEQRVKAFRKDLVEFRQNFENMKSDRAETEHNHSRSELLGNRCHSSATPENPYANVNTATHARPSPFTQSLSNTSFSAAVGIDDRVFREQDFMNRTDTQLDEFLDRGRAVLSDLNHQREMLKGTQRRLYTVANTLGISGDTIRMIERRAMHDKWLFYGGVVVFFTFCYLVLRWIH